MKNKIALVLLWALLNLWTPLASAEINQELDPMVPVDLEMIAGEEAPASGVKSDQAGPAVNAADAKPSKTKAEEPKKKRSKKEASKKSSSKKSGKSDPKKSKKSAKTSN